VIDERVGVIPKAAASRTHSIRFATYNGCFLFWSALVEAMG